MLHICTIVIAALFFNAFADPPDVEWMKLIGGDDVDRIYCLCSTPDSCYVAGGFSYSFSPVHELWLIKIDDDGDTVWSCTYAYELNGISAVSSLENGDIIITGGGWGNFWLKRLNPSGDVIWSEIYEVPDLGHIFDIAISSNGIIATAGCTMFIPDTSIVIASDLDGNLLWVKKYPSSIYTHSKFIGIDTCGSDGFILAGWVHYSPKPRAVRINYSGDVIWDRLYDDIPDIGTFTDVVTVQDGFVFVANVSSADNTGLVKVNSTGDTLWTIIYDLTATQRCTRLLKLPDESFLIAGTEEESGYFRDVFSLAADQVGNLLWNGSWDVCDDDVVWGAALAADGGYVFAGCSENPFSGLEGDGFIIKLNPWTGVEEDPLLITPVCFDIYPNPSNASVSVTTEGLSCGYASLIVYDLSGRILTELYNGSVSSEGLQCVWNGVASLPSGLFFIRLETDQHVLTKSMVILH